MNAIDIIIIVITAAGIFLGWRKGLIAQIGKFVGLCAAVLACRMFGPVVADWFVGANTDSGDSAVLWTFAAYLLIFVSVYIGVTLLSSGLKKVVHTLTTPFIDRLCGALFRVFLYMIGVSIMLNLWLLIFPDSTLRRDKMISHKPVFIDVSILTLAPKVLGSCAVPDFIDYIWRTENHDDAARVTHTDVKR